LLAVFIALGIVSLLAAKIMFPQSPSATFYLMPFRIYEFAIGAALALLPALDKLNNRYREALTVIGCALIVYSVLAFDKRTPFPELNALLPCLGAACLIVGGMATYSGWLLRNPVSVFVGKISYSLYLVHWPIVVLYKHISFEDVVVGKTRIALFILTLIAAVMLNRLVENRFRYAPEKRPRKSLTMLLVWWAMPVLIALASLHAYAIDGWSGRFDRQVIQAIGDVEAKQLIRRQYIETPQSLSNLPFDQAAPVKILIMGDSHATDAFNALHLANPAPDSVSVRRLEIDDVCLYLLEPGAVSDEPEHVQRRCREHWRFVQSSPLLDQSNWVVISTRWERASFAYLPIFIDYLQSRDNQVILMGRTAEFKNVPSLVLKYGLGEGIGAALAVDRDVSIDALNDELKSLGDSLAVAYIDKLPHLCELSQSICDVIDADGRILYTDYGHWSIEGAHYFGKKIWSDSELGGLLGID
ncbi:MAG: acyltransferase, partial [Granulosicoccus sp.]|nr:acyltransferase [Granulosicoccus sp.]